MEFRDLMKLTFEVPQALYRTVMNELEALGIQDILAQHGRLSQFAAPRLISLPGSESLEENPSVLIQTWVPPELELPVMTHLSLACKLDLPGRGSAWSQKVHVLCPPDFLKNLEAIALTGKSSPAEEAHFLTDLMGISFILQRGLAKAVAKAVLGQGACVPGVVYAQGAGMRDKLGLLRITIPAAKEILQIALPEHDALGMTLRLMEEAKLTQAGKSFISWFPIERAILNTRIHLGAQGHAASMEQVISAIDTVKGGTWWRRRFDSPDQSNVPGMKDLIALNVVSDEVNAPKIASMAMDAGAPGATVVEMQYHHLGSGNPWPGESAKKVTMMVLGHAQAFRVLNAMKNHEGGNLLSGGFVEEHSRPRAFTYLGAGS